MTTYTVTNSTELSAALGKVVGGDTIALASGNYSSLSLSSKVFSAPVTITSLDGSAPAHIDRLSVNSVTNLTLSNLDIGRALTATEATSVTMNQISNSKNIVVEGTKFHGSLDGNPQNDGLLLAVRGSDTVTIRGCEFTEGYRGAFFNRSTNLTVADNNVHLMRCDGFDLAAVQNVLIQGNHIGGFVPVAGDHPDAIQFWTTNETVGSSHIKISDNVIMPTMGAGNQGIFMSDEVGTLAYQDVTITNNLLYSNGGEWHGIYANHFIGATIGNNTVVSTTNDSMKYWIDIVNSQNLDVIGNVTDRILTSNSTDIRFADNIDFTASPSATALIPNLNLGYLTMVSDLLVSGFGYQAPAGQGDGIGGTVIVAENPVYGTVGSDTVQGTAGKDKLWGVGATDSALGRGTVDKLWGAGSTDTFVLGDERGRFYDDGKSKSAGKGDYAQIMDFGLGDHIQLHGSMAQYLMKAGSVGGLAGVQIFFDSNANGQVDSRDEMIGHVVGVSSLSPESFVFG
jgi:hypothetical protein